MTSMEQEQDVVPKEGTRPAGVESNNGNHIGHNSGSAKTGEGVVSHPLPTTSTSGAEAVVGIKNDNLTSPSRKRIRLSLKGKPVATVSVMSGPREIHPHPHPQVHNSAAPPPRNSTATVIKVEQRAESYNGDHQHKSLVVPKTEDDQAAAVRMEDESSSPPKKKIKLVVAEVQGKPEAKESTSSNHGTYAVQLQLDRNNTAGTKSSEASGDAPEAMVLENGVDGEDDAVAAVVEEPPKAKKVVKRKLSLPTKTSSALNQTKRNAAALRSVRMTPMSSPGLLVPPGIYRGPVDSDGLVSPNAIFVDAMTKAGYTFDTRTDDPHRGSSVQRVVDDMYDSNVKLCLNFPNLVPKKYVKQEEYPSAKRAEDSTAAESTKSEKFDLPMHTEQTKDETTDPKLKVSVAERLIKALEANTEGDNVDLNWIERQQPGKRSSVRRFIDMIPVSLTLPYPEDYITKRLEYVKLVEERESKIVALQEDEEQIEILKEKYAAIGEHYPGPMKSEIVVPPIPVPPDPPKLDEMQGMDTELYCNQEHPFYRSKNELVEHLDKRCFHITDGRYFGLTSCGLADQHFVGPNAPGVGGLHLSSVAGLATSSTSGAPGGVQIFDPPSTLAGPRSSAALGIVSAKTSVKIAPTTSTKTQESTTSKQNADAAKSKQPSTFKSTTEALKTGSASSKNGPTVTSTKHHLKLIMENGGETAEKMRMVIIKAAVHALRAGKLKDRSFRGLDRKVYPDVAKAFTTHSGLKPCRKCKSNKQGTYHCRFRRRHDELDFDGGDSWKILGPLFEAPLGDLLIKPLKKKEDFTDKPADNSNSY